jgi:hypothetical protein
MAGYSYRLESYSHDYGHPIQVELDVAELVPVWSERVPDERGETRGVAGHGAAAYRWRKCRCDVCVAAKARSNREYREKRRAPPAPPLAPPGQDSGPPEAALKAQ